MGVTTSHERSMTIFARVRPRKSKVSRRRAGPAIDRAIDRDRDRRPRAVERRAARGDGRGDGCAFRMDEDASSG